MDVSPPKSSAAAWYWPIIKRTCYLVVLFFIARRAIQLWNTAPAESISVNGLWLIPAGMIYFVGWLPSVWFWKAVLRRMRQSVDWYDVVRAYYVGNMGKYIPGKALVIILRASMLAEVGVNSLLAGVTVVCESLVFVATGAALALALSPVAFGDTVWRQLPAQMSWLRSQPLLSFLIVGLATFATTPISAWLFTKASLRTMTRDPSDFKPPAKISAGLISQGVLVLSLGWACHAMSLGLVLQSVSSHPFDIRQFPIWLGACTASVVGGFFVPFAPAGLGVREGLLIEALKDQPQIGPAIAIMAAGLLRAVWFTTELAAAGVLFLAGKQYFVRKEILDVRD